MMMKKYTPVEALFAAARCHEPFGVPNSFGFEICLKAAIADSAPSGIELIGRLSWRFTIACLPLLLVAFVLLGFQYSDFLPEGLGGVVSQWSFLIPGDLL